MYEANRRDDKVQPDNIVRSQFGSPAPSGNGQHQAAASHSTGDNAEQYRFDPSRPRRRRYAPSDDDTTEETGTAIDPSEAGGWTVNRKKPSPSPSESSETPPRQRRSARRHAATNDDSSSTPRSADLDRIAAFLRSSQQAQQHTDETKSTDVAVPRRGRHHSAADTAVAHEHDDATNDKTSELPTVVDTNAEALSNSDVAERVLAAVRKIPGISMASISDTDQKLSLDVADGADTKEVHRQVAAILDSQLGLRTRPTTSRASEPVPKQGSRVLLERVQAVTSGFEATIEVALVSADTRAVGRACSPAVDWHIYRGAAEACVDAVGILLGNKAKVVIEHAAIEPAGPVDVAVVVVLLLTEDKAEQLAGAATATGDRRQAIVHATLAALNRRLEKLLF